MMHSFNLWLGIPPKAELQRPFSILIHQVEKWKQNKTEIKGRGFQENPEFYHMKIIHMKNRSLSIKYA